jgi:hypothetical protein
MEVVLEKELNQVSSIKGKDLDKVGCRYPNPQFSKILITHSKHLTHHSNKYQQQHIFQSLNTLQSHNQARLRMIL